MKALRGFNLGALLAIALGLEKRGEQKKALELRSSISRAQFARGSNPFPAPRRIGGGRTIYSGRTPLVHHARALPTVNTKPQPWQIHAEKLRARAKSHLHPLARHEAREKRNAEARAAP